MFKNSSLTIINLLNFKIKLINFLFFQDDQSQDGSDSEVDEVEPRLKYVRMGNDLENILQRDAASCIAVHPKVILISLLS